MADDSLSDRVDRLEALLPDTLEDGGHPTQPIEVGEDGVPRFKCNKLVRYLLDAGGIDLNQLAVLPGIAAEDHIQLAQLIGYSVDGFAGLNYVPDELAGKVDRAAEWAIKAWAMSEDA